MQKVIRLSAAEKYISIDESAYHSPHDTRDQLFWLQTKREWIMNENANCIAIIVIKWNRNREHLFSIGPHAM